MARQNAMRAPLERLKERPTPLPVPITPQRLCELCQAAGITIYATSRTTLSVRPREAITQEIGEAIQHHKLALATALFTMAPTTPFVCAFCAAEFVSAPASTCTMCGKLVGQPLRFAPDSYEERAFLRALERRRNH